MSTFFFLIKSENYIRIERKEKSLQKMESDLSSSSGRRQSWEPMRWQNFPQYYPKKFHLVKLWTTKLAFLIIWITKNSEKKQKNKLMSSTING